MFDQIKTIPTPETTTTAATGTEQQAPTPPPPPPPPNPDAGADDFVKRASKDLDFIQTGGFNNDTMGDFLRDSPHMSDRPVYGDPDGEEDGDDAGESPKDGRPWYRKIFADSPHSPEQLEQQIGGDLDGLAPKMAVQLSDTLFPTFISTLKDEADGSKYRASTEVRVGGTSQLDDLKAAWTYWLMSHRIRVTPGFYLIYIHGIIYGMPLLGGLAAYISRVQLYGWHWPWSKSWKKKEQEMLSRMPGQRGPIQQPTQQAPAQPTQPVAAAPQQPTQPQPAPQSAPQQAAPAPPRKEKRCLYTDKVFEEGKGFPKNAKNPDLTDAFIDLSAFRSYCNANGLTGQQVNTRKS